MPVVNLPETCEGCGACCYGLLVEVPDSDLTDHGTPESLTRLDGNTRYMEQVEADNGRCIALDPQTRRCTIYPNRPQVCRDFTRADEGNDLCLEVVANMGKVQGRMALPPKPRLQVAIEALAKLKPADLDGQPNPLRLRLLTLALDHVSYELPRQLAGVLDTARELKRTVDLLAYANPEALQPKATGALDQSGAHDGFVVDTLSTEGGPDESGTGIHGHDGESPESGGAGREPGAGGREGDADPA